ncbi:unnamed protein product [Larinioides sclopetarius]|uniref:Uncharacterized protein n=1 Tax=Larinioides sclopetarius TaxID=280406 RepID=A0AAV1YWK2_9ARAC
MMFFSVLAFCLLMVGLRGDSTTEPDTSNNFNELSVDDFIATVSIIENFTGIYVFTQDTRRAFTPPIATTTENVTIHRNINEQAENNTRFVCGKYNPCHWQLYSEARKFEMGYSSVCDCPNNTVCRYYRDNISIRAFEFRCIEVNLTSTEPETSSATEMASSSAH